MIKGIVSQAELIASSYDDVPGFLYMAISQNDYCRLGIGTESLYNVQGNNRLFKWHHYDCACFTIILSAVPRKMAMHKDI